MHQGPRTDDEIIAHVLISTWQVTTGRTLRSDVPPAELDEAELIDFWADDQLAEPAQAPCRLTAPGRGGLPGPAAGPHGPPRAAVRRAAGAWP